MVRSFKIETKILPFHYIRRKAETGVRIPADAFLKNETEKDSKNKLKKELIKGYKIKAEKALRTLKDWELFL